jgi:predicted transcriptional regulator
MKNDTLKRIVTPSKLNDYFVSECKKDKKLLNILKSGKQFTKEDVEQLAQLPIER